MVDFAKIQEQSGIMRKRTRKSSFTIDREEIGNRVVKFYEKDSTARLDFMDDRLQRYAKYRMWSERESLPWEAASDVALPDLAADSLRMQDTLHNAVMGQMPPVSAEATLQEEVDKEDPVTNLITHQLFIDQNGEEMIGELAETFINDGVYTIFIPWVKEEREFSDLRILPAIPIDVAPREYFQGQLAIEFPENINLIPEENNWDWTVEQVDKPDATVKFFTREKDDRVEMVIEQQVEVFNGPKPIVKDIDEVLHPWRVANLQIPGPSNPGGSAHVILMDFPSIDELKRLKKSGFYDLVTDEELKKLETVPMDRDDQELKVQKDRFQGTTEEQHDADVISHNTLTRLLCFDSFDIDGDGIDEDVIWWVIKETKTVLKAKLLTEMYPSNPPRRPFAEASMIPVKGRRLGISYLELGEGLHDVMKETIDQMIDAGTITTSPFFFYKSTSLQKPEVLTLAPGEGYPLADPKNDIEFPNLQNNSQAFGINMITLLTQMKERLTMVGDLQAGKIPAGKSSALRTQGGINALLGQAEARPERILRRFFMGLTELYSQIHELNQHFLPEKKKIKLLGTLDPDVDPYQTITDRGMIEGRFQFKFKANVFNISKGALQTALQNIMAVTISPLTLQLGISNQDTIFRTLKKFIESWGQEPRDFINPPTPNADQQLIQAEEAIVSIMNDIMPTGQPFEGFIGHLQKLQEFVGSENIQHLTASQTQLLTVYLQQILVGAQQEAQQQQLLEAAGQFQTAQGSDTGGETAGAPDLSNPSLNENETIDRGMQ